MPRGGGRSNGRGRGNSTPRGHGGRGGGRGGANNFRPSFVPFGSNGDSGHHALTLAEEARNTSHGQDFWNTDKKLRHSKVNFISAGSLIPLEPLVTEPLNTESAMANMSLDSPKDEEAMEDEDMAAPSVADSALPAISSAESDPVPFIVDTYGSGPVKTNLPAPHIRSSSPTPSNSSEEVILFRGRDQQGNGKPRAAPNVRVPAPDLELKPKLERLEGLDVKMSIVEERLHEQEAILEELLSKPKTSIPVQTPEPSSSEQDVRYSGLPSLPVQTDSAEASEYEQDVIHFSAAKSTRTQRRRGRRGQGETKRAEEDALVADYIANMDEEELNDLKSFANRELGGDDDALQDTGASSSDSKKIDDILNSGWGPQEIEDFDDLSTSEEVLGEVHMILSKRERNTGIQYLVQWQNMNVDEARWVPATNLTSEIALAHVMSFEREEMLVAQIRDTEGEDTSESEDIDLKEFTIHVQDEEDEQVDVPMSDEQMARLLAKQEELGMGSAELLLYDDPSDADFEGEAPTARNRFSPATLRSKGKGKAKAFPSGSKRPRGEYPSATMMADAFNVFDVMDFERPSLQRQPKGRRGKPVMENSDSELEAIMEMSFENDRAKKKERKQEREELRAQGLLGNKNGKPDLKQKYKEGMGIHAVKEEIKAFLSGEDTTLALSPMDKADRKVVHELANAFFLKSKSVGAGDSRRPILYKNKRTRRYNAHTFELIENKISRRYLPRRDIGKKAGAGKSERGQGGGGGFNKAAVSYRDGDVVGASAPELGSDNRGRAMLEKMGWSSGTALGALNNKGILQPVSHVVKITKAGLQ